MHMIHPDCDIQPADKQSFLSDLWEHISINRQKTKLVTKQTMTETQEAVGNQRTVFSCYEVIIPVLHCQNCSFGTTSLQVFDRFVAKYPTHATTAFSHRD